MDQNGVVGDALTVIIVEMFIIPSLKSGPGTGVEREKIILVNHEAICVTVTVGEILFVGDKAGVRIALGGAGTHEDNADFLEKTGMAFGGGFVLPEILRQDRGPEEKERGQRTVAEHPGIHKRIAGHQGAGRFPDVGIVGEKVHDFIHVHADIDSGFQGVAGVADAEIMKIDGAFPCFPLAHDLVMAVDEERIRRIWLWSKSADGREMVKDAYVTFFPRTGVPAIL